MPGDNDTRSGSEGTGGLDKQSRWEGAAGEEGISENSVFVCQPGHQNDLGTGWRQTAGEARTQGMCLSLDNDN